MAPTRFATRRPTVDLVALRARAFRATGLFRRRTTDRPFARPAADRLVTELLADRLTERLAVRRRRADGTERTSLDSGDAFIARDWRGAARRTRLRPTRLEDERERLAMDAADRLRLRLAIEERGDVAARLRARRATAGPRAARLAGCFTMVERCGWLPGPVRWMLCAVRSHRSKLVVLSCRCEEASGF